MAQVPRVSVAEAWKDSQSGDAILVCAYEDEAKCRRILFEGALTLQELEARRPTLPRDKALYFYCA